MLRTFAIVVSLTFALIGNAADVQSRTLTPIVTGFVPVPGANGSLWRSEVWASSAGGQVININGNFPCAGGPSPLVCFAARLDGSGAALKLPFNAAGGGKDGQFALVPSGGDVRFYTRVQDLSRQEQTWGTSLPVVHESRFANRVALVDVPTDVRFRSSLRIYSLIEPQLNGPPLHVRVQIRPLAGFGDLVDEIHDIVGGDTTGSFAGPGYLQIPLDAWPQLRGTERLRIVLTSESKIWGFVSVTNNETQHVTVVSPQ